jgi:hypothetical protein
MGFQLTVEIPDDLARRAKALAAVSNRRLEDAVVEWIDRAVAEPDLADLPDAKVLELCDATLDDARQRELSDLLGRWREGELAETEERRLDELMAVYRRGLVLKARAAHEAVARGLRARLDNHAA